MFKKFKTLIVIALSGFIIMAPAAVMPSLANAQTPGDAACQGAEGVSGGKCADTSGTINAVVETAIRILQIIAGIIALVYVILGGIRYATSSGDTSKVSSAKNAILYALIGIAVVALAEILVQFVLNRVNDAAVDSGPTTSYVQLTV